MPAALLSSVGRLKGCLVQRSPKGEGRSIDEWLSLRIPGSSLQSALVAAVLSVREYECNEDQAIVEITGDWPPPALTSWPTC